jgi:hypothetical protein
MSTYTPIEKIVKNTTKGTVTESKKHKEFTNETMHKKLIDTLPGIGPAHKAAFNDRKIVYADQLYGLFLLCNKEREAFGCAITSASASVCFNIGLGMNLSVGAITIIFNTFMDYNLNFG